MFLEEKAPGELPHRERGLPTEITKLSEAIRIGAAKRPQCEAAYFRHGRSCALGAAAEGMFGVTPETYNTKHIDRALALVPGEIAAEIIRRNDGREGYPRMTREAIADWLEAQGY